MFLLRWLQLALLVVTLGFVQGLAPGALAAEPAADVFHAVAEDPGNPAVSYAATDQGLFRTVDDGATWSHIPISESVLEIRAVAVSPNDSSVLLAGSGSGLFLSIDGGATWQKLKKPREQVTAVAFAAGNPQVIIAGTRRKGVAISVDGGQHFKSRLSKLPRPVGKGSKTIITGVAAHPTDPGIAWAGTEVNGIYRLFDRRFSAPGGTQVLLPTRTERILIAPDPVDPSIVYGLIPTPVNSFQKQNRLYRSQDGGVTWPEYSVVAGDGTLTALYFRGGDGSVLYARDRASLVAFLTAGLSFVPAMSESSGGPRVLETQATVTTDGDIAIITDDGLIARRIGDATGCDDRPGLWNIETPQAMGAYAAHGLEVPQILVIYAATSWRDRTDPTCGWISTIWPVVRALTLFLCAIRSGALEWEFSTTPTSSSFHRPWKAWST